MPHAPRISLSLRGPRQMASLDDLAVAINAFRSSLRNVYRCVTGVEDAEFDVADLRIGSAVIEAEPIPKFAEAGPAVAELYEDTVQAIQEGRPLDPRIDFRTIATFNLFSAIAKRPNVSLSIGRTAVTKHYSERIAALLEPESTSLGSVSGRLEGISIHGTNRFILYPPIRGEQVECVFNRKDLAAVAEALERNVTVYGRLGYVRGKAFPVRINVDTFEVATPGEELPTLLNACGIMRTAMRSTELIREGRNVWD
jgi:hypothetical protein